MWGNGKEWRDRLLRRTLQKTELKIVQDYPIYDVWGKPASRTDSPVGADWLWRIMVPVKVQDAEIFVADRVLLNWNNQHPDDEAVFPTMPLPYYTKNGKRHAMTDEEYAEFTRRSGELARKRLTNWKPTSIEKPSKASIKRIQKAVEESRKLTRDRMFGAGKPRKTGLKPLKRF